MYIKKSAILTDCTFIIFPLTRLYRWVISASLFCALSLPSCAIHSVSLTSCHGSVSPCFLSPCSQGVRASHRFWKLLLAILNPIGCFIETYVPLSTFITIDNIIAFLLFLRPLHCTLQLPRYAEKTNTFGLLLWLASTSVTPLSSLCYPLPKRPCSTYGTRTRNYHLERVVT